MGTGKVIAQSDRDPPSSPLHRDPAVHRDGRHPVVAGTPVPRDVHDADDGAGDRPAAARRGLPRRRPPALCGIAPAVCCSWEGYAGAVGPAEAPRGRRSLPVRAESDDLGGAVRAAQRGIRSAVVAARILGTARSRHQHDRTFPWSKSRSSKHDSARHTWITGVTSAGSCPACARGSRLTASPQISRSPSADCGSLGSRAADLRQHAFEQRRHPPELPHPDDQIPGALEFLPADRVGEVLGLMLPRLVRARGAGDRRPAIELAVGPVVARFEGGRRQTRRPIDDVAGVVQIPVPGRDASLLLHLRSTGACRDTASGRGRWRS